MCKSIEDVSLIIENMRYSVRKDKNISHIMSAEFFKKHLIVCHKHMIIAKIGVN